MNSIQHISHNERKYSFQNLLMERYNDPYQQQLITTIPVLILTVFHYPLQLDKTALKNQPTYLNGY